jgi:hypothetical protein
VTGPTERECEDTIIAAALLLGYFVHAERPARSNKGWRTPVRGNPGWPDLFIVGHGHAFAIELKRKGNRPTPEQCHWINQLGLAGIDARLVYVPEGQQELIDDLAAAAKTRVRHGTVV